MTITIMMMTKTNSNNNKDDDGDDDFCNSNISFQNLGSKKIHIKMSEY